MDSLLSQVTEPQHSAQAKNSQQELSTLNTPAAIKAQANLRAIQSISHPQSRGKDSVDLSFDQLYKNLSITAKKVIDKLNELLKNELPDGIQSLNPEDHTAEKTADRIVSQVTGLFGAFSKQNPNLEPAELLSSFMEQVRSGVQKGYDEAFDILEGLGAFSFDDVKSGVEQTKVLIEQKLIQFEDKMKIQLGLKAEGEQNPTEQATATVTPQVLKQGASHVLHYAA